MFIELFIRFVVRVDIDFFLGDGDFDFIVIIKFLIFIDISGFLLGLLDIIYL